MTDAEKRVAGKTYRYVASGRTTSFDKRGGCVGDTAQPGWMLWMVANGAAEEVRTDDAGVKEALVAAPEVKVGDRFHADGANFTLVRQDDGRLRRVFDNGFHGMVFTLAEARQYMADGRWRRLPPEPAKPLCEACGEEPATQDWNWRPSCCERLVPLCDCCYYADEGVAVKRHRALKHPEPTAHAHGLAVGDKLAEPHHRRTGVVTELEQYSVCVTWSDGCQSFPSHACADTYLRSGEWVRACAHLLTTPGCASCGPTTEGALDGIGRMMEEYQRHCEERIARELRCNAAVPAPLPAGEACRHGKSFRRCEQCRAEAGLPPPARTPECACLQPSCLPCMSKRADDGLMFGRMKARDDERRRLALEEAAKRRRPLPPALQWSPAAMVGGMWGGRGRR